MKCGDSKGIESLNHRLIESLSNHSMSQSLNESIARESAAGHADKNVFESRFADGESGDQAGKGFDELGDEFMSFLTFEANGAFDELGFDLEFFAERGGEA